MVKDINMIISYKYSDDDLANWVLTIYRLFPGITPEVIGRITDNFLKGIEYFDKDEGILNYTKLIQNYMGKFDNQ